MFQKPKLGAKRGQKVPEMVPELYDRSCHKKTEDVFYITVPLMLVKKRKRHQLPCRNTVNRLCSHIQSVCRCSVWALWLIWKWLYDPRVDEGHWMKALVSELTSSLLAVRFKVLPCFYSSMSFQHLFSIQTAKMVPTMNSTLSSYMQS